MSGDSLLTLAIQFLVFLIAGVGIFLALHPLEKIKHKVVCVVAFTLIGIAVVVLNTIQSNRASTEQSELRARIDRIQSDNRQGFDDLQARLDAVVAAVKTAPPNTNVRKLSAKVAKLAAPNPPTNLVATVQ
jgi:hypothetical protein